MPISSDIIQRIDHAVDQDRLLETAVALMEVPSPTCDAAGVANRLSDLLTEEGFEVERPVADWPKAPAVVTRWHARDDGPTLQFDGHLDTVHLPYTPPRIEQGVLSGQGAADMKAGLAAAIEALRILRDTEVLEKGGILLTAHDHHEAPWGDSRQVYGLINAGYVGDAVLIPEYLADRIPIAGRGQAVLDIKIRRGGERVHEVLRPSDQPDVIAAGADVVRRLKAMNDELAKTTYPYVGPETVFIGQMHSGEIFNQSPVECGIEGTRRWVAGHDIKDVEADFHEWLDTVAQETRTTIDRTFTMVRDGFQIDEGDPLVIALQSAHETVTGRSLPLGGKPFVDDGNAFAAQGKVSALAHGPAAEGAHTTHERVSINELERVAKVYALAAVYYCNGWLERNEDWVIDAATRHRK